MIALALAVSLVLGGENRLWYVELELRGACDELRLDCGAAGSTRLAGPFQGDARRWSVPVPVRSPLGAEGLGTVSLPTLAVSPASSAGAARVLGWSAEQPARNLLGLRAAASGPRPTPPALPARAGPPELALVLVAGALLLALRRRIGLAVLLACGAAGLAFVLARGRAMPGAAERVIEWEAGDELALRVSATRDRAPLSGGALEVSPEGLPLEFVLARGDAGEALARGARLALLEGLPAPALAARANGFEPLDEVWTRTAEGAWRAHGPWGVDAPLPAGRASEAPGLPGWLAAGLPPGRSVLVAKSARGAWLRCRGFELP